MAEEIRQSEFEITTEARKVKALEKIAMNLEALVLLFENLNLEEWDERLQWYLNLAKEAFIDPKLEKEDK